MATHRVLQCELFQARRESSAGSLATTSSGFSLVMCSSRKRCNKRVCCSTEVMSSSVKKWMVAGVAAAVVMGGVGDQPAMAAFGWFGQPQVEKDPVEPFTLYGSILKKYMIEDVVENRVVSRKKGFTASACVNALDASKETPELQGVPAGLKVTIIGEPSCSKGQGQTREESCTAPCTKACQAAVSRHLMEVKEETGYVLDASDIKKVTETCSLQCFNECKLRHHIFCLTTTGMVKR